MYKPYITRGDTLIIRVEGLDYYMYSFDFSGTGKGYQYSMIMTDGGFANLIAATKWALGELEVLAPVPG